MMPWALAQPVPAVPEAASRARVLICTPTRSRMVGDNYRLCVDVLRQKLRENVLPLSTLPAHRDDNHQELIKPELVDDARSTHTGVLAQTYDLSRTRDRMIRQFIERTDADWLLFWDDDVWMREPHVVLANMLTCAAANDLHVLGALYPRKARDEGRIAQAVREGRSNPLQHGFVLQDMRFWMRSDFVPKTPHPWLMEVNGIGFGFCLISRACAISLTERYRTELSWDDHILGGRTVGLCHGIIDGFSSFSEDYSFCVRAANGGFSVYAYLGPGSPVIHDGMDSFEAHPDCLLHKKGDVR